MAALDSPGSINLPEGTKPFEFGGQTYKAGDTFTDTEACTLVAFYAAAKAKNQDAIRQDQTPGAWETIEAKCPAAPTIPPGSAPSGFGTTAAPGQNGDSPGALGAPSVTQPPTTAAVLPPSPPPPPPAEEQRRPDTGQTDPDQVRSTPQQTMLVSDPVDAFSGAYVVQETDLEIPNTMLPLALVRSYRSGVPAFGPFGWNWDHNFNIYLRELETGDVAVWRTLHEDVFTFDGTAFEPPRGVFERLERLPGPGQGWQLLGAGGTVQRFEQPGGWMDGERIPLVRIEDRHGNALQLRYGQSDRLAEVADDDGRRLRFQYDDCGLIVAISDQAGRTYGYAHDETAFHLTGVTTPPTTDHPRGITRHYHYANADSPPALRHNIVRVEDGARRSFVETAYDEDPASLAFARVVRQLFGGHLYQYDYTQLQVVPPDDAFVNVPAMQVEVANPDLALEVYTFNFRGDLLDDRFRLMKDRSYRIVAIQYEYDRHGNRTVTRLPDGSEERRTYDEGNQDPRMRGLLLRRELTAATARPAPSRIVWRASYDAAHLLLKEERDESGAVTRHEYDFDLTPGAADNTGKLKRIVHPDATLPDGTTQTSEVTYEHDTRGRVTAIVDPNGVRTELAYGTAGDAAGRLASRTADVNGLAATETYEYDAFGYLTATVDAEGRRRVTAYNALGQVERIVLPAIGGRTAEQVLHYDDDRLVMALVRPRGAYDDPVLARAALTDTLRRDVLGNPVAIVLAANSADPRAVRSSFDHRGLPLRSLNPDGSRIDRVYDERGLLIAETYRGADGTKEAATRTYDTSSRLVSATAPGGATTAYSYDGFGRLRVETMPNGSEIRRTWGPGDVLESVEVVGVDEQGATRSLSEIRYAYDERLRRVRETVRSFDEDPATAVDVTTATYHDPGGRVVRTVDHRGAEERFRYDGLDRVVAAADPVGNETEHEYDAVGNVLVMRRRDREPDGTMTAITTRYEYDERNRKTATVMPDGSRHRVEYDDRDLPVAEVDQLGVRVEVGYDAYGVRVQEERDPGGLAILHQWRVDVLGRTTSYVDPTGETSRYELDGLGRRRKTSYPNGLVSARTFDAAGNVVRESLSSGAQFDYEYDAANRLTHLRATGASAGRVAVADHEFRYDGLDRLVEARAGADRVTRRYDSRGRLRREQTRGGVMACDYDDDAGTLTRSWPDGREERIVTDLGGRATAFEQTAAGGMGSGNGMIATIAASGPGHLGRAAFRGGLVLDATYDDRKRLVELAAASPAGLAETCAYRYDSADRRRIEARDGVAADRTYFTFDTARRLTGAAAGLALPLPAAATQGDHDAAIAAAAAAAGRPTDGFEYDDADARLRATYAGRPPVVYVNGAGHVPLSADTEAFAHGPDGVRLADGDFTYRHDVLGRIVDVSTAAATICTIEYDALGRPSAIRENGQPARAFMWFGAHIHQESDGATVVRHITRDPVTGMSLAEHVAGATRHPLFDGRGNLIGLADDSGQLLEGYRYEPFGIPAILDSNGTPLASSAFGITPVFGGQRHLRSVGRYLSTNRVMDPRHGVFLSPDPLGYTASPSLYAYAAQDPIDLVDPDGDFAFIAVLLVMAIGAVVAGVMNATRQGIQMAENPARRAEGFSWSEFGWSMGIGAVAAPVLTVAPEAAIPLAGLGVFSGAREIYNGNYATAAFDIATSVVPFKFQGVRGSVAGKGTIIGQWRDLGPAALWAERFGRFDAIAKSFRNFRPFLSGRRVGVAFTGDQTAGHSGVTIEDPAGNVTLLHKNARRTAVEDWELESDWALESPPPSKYPYTGKAFAYESLEVPRSTAEAMNAYARARMATTEEFAWRVKSCGNFTGDVLNAGGFRDMGPFNLLGSPDLWANWKTFVPAFTSARNTTWAAGFWSGARFSTPNRKCVPSAASQPTALGQ